MKLKFLFLLILLPVPALSQWNPDMLLSNPTLEQSDTNKIKLDADVIGFFKNNEYFSPVSKGETYPGVLIIPKAYYQIDDKIRAELGLTGLYYSGDQQKEGTFVFNGIFTRLQYAIKPNFNLIFGNYYGGVNHRLIEPLYKWESHLTNKPESGLQLIFENEKRFVDVWINWQRFIERGDTVPEVLTFGLSTMFALNSNNRLKLSVPLQLIIDHQGGQIDQSSASMIVSGNAASGICSEYSLNSKFFKAIGLNLYFVGYYDKLPDKPMRPFSKGWGIYPVFTVDATPFKFMAGYWYANKFFSFDGEPLFSSFNPNYPENVIPTRTLLTIKFSYSQQLHKMFAIGTQVETYTDLNRGATDYSFGVYLRLKLSGIN